MISINAPAKINLYLHITGRRLDGYHLIDSLIAFADISDKITVGLSQYFLCYENKNFLMTLCRIYKASQKKKIKE